MAKVESPAGLIEAMGSICTATLRLIWEKIREGQKALTM
jgi:hypothetical protein